MKILIVRVGAMGDVLHALPGVAALRNARPDWTIDWAIDKRWAPLLVNREGVAPIVNRAHLADTQSWSPFSLATLHALLDLRRTLCKARYDLVVDMQGTLRSAVIGRMAGAPLLAGYADPRESLAAAMYTVKLPRLGTHVVDMGTALLSAATAVALTATDVGLPHDAEAEHWAVGVTGTRPLCVLAPGAGWGAKRWPAANFGALALALHERGYEVVVNASRENDALAESVVAASDNTARAIPCDLSSLIALLRRASLLVGGDSGPTHLAAALGVPLVALFGPTDPARNGPSGTGVSRVLRDPVSVTSYKRVDAPDPGLEQLSVEAVLEAVAKLAASSRETP